MPRTNTPPAHVWEALRRLLDCNKTQLAARLGIDPRTLKRWEQATENGEPPSDLAALKARALLSATLNVTDQSDQFKIQRGASQ